MAWRQYRDSAIKGRPNWRRIRGAFNGRRALIESMVAVNKRLACYSRLLFVLYEAPAYENNNISEHNIQDRIH
jgi:hypothetical protein